MVLLLFVSPIFCIHTHWDADPLSPTYKAKFYETTFQLTLESMKT